MANSKPITLEQLFRFYKGLPHQMAAIQMLEEDIKENGYVVAMRRDRPWFAVWSQSGKQRDYQAGVELIKKFEGFHHDAYLCPAGVWTIGWGNTAKADGSPVIPGDRISQEEGDALLQKTIDGIVLKLAGSIPYWSAMKEHQQSALISFAYNLGSYFYGQESFETISRCLRERTYKSVPAALLLYCNPGSSFEAGLTRRRKAEGQLWAGEQAAEEKPRETVKLRPGENILDVPYEYQLDNASGTGYRECFSSTCAMIARYHGKIDSDDEYNIIRARFGDTTVPHTHIKALRFLGLDARFRTDCSSTTIKTEIDAGRPLGVGWLHQGLIQMPAGGGHWTCVVGYTEEAIVHNDPNGEADMINGGYVSNAATTGRGVHYSRKNWLRRWEADGANTGWAILVRPEF
jgi:GH24 family phage-related lysozyme (muramidase)